MATVAMTEAELPIDTLVCNCSRCNMVMLGASMAKFHSQLTRDERRRWPPIVKDWISERPVCRECVRKLNAKVRERNYAVEQLDRDA